MTEHFNRFSDSYKVRKIAEEYDAVRFTSIAGQVLNWLEKKCLRKILFFLIKNENLKNVLDIPCGTGRITGVLAELKLNIIASDISKEMIDVAQRRLSHFSTIHYEIRNIKDTQFDSNIFDCITCIRLLHHLGSEDRICILSELARVTKKYLIVNIPYSSPWYRFRRRLKRILKQGVSRVSISEEELQNELIRIKRS